MTENLHQDIMRAQIKGRLTAAFGAVYAIADGDRVKIGWAFDPVARLRQLQIGNANQLCLIGYVAAVDPAKDVERGLHDIFAERRISGEWFDDSDGEITAVFRQLEKRGY